MRTSIPPTPRPATHYHSTATWYLVDDDLAPTIAARPATDAESSDDWVLSFTAAGTTDDDPALEREELYGL